MVGVFRGVLQGTALKINLREKFSKAFSPKLVGQRAFNNVGLGEWEVSFGVVVEDKFSA